MSVCLFKAKLALLMSKRISWGLTNFLCTKALLGVWQPSHLEELRSFVSLLETSCSWLWEIEGKLFLG